MCLTCGEHFSKRLWYLEPEKHRIRSQGLLRDIVNNAMPPLLSAAYGFVKKKQPYGADTFPGPSRRLLNWLTKTIHGMQVLPELDSAFQIIDLAQEVALVPCLCRQALYPELPSAWHCIGLNMAARIYYQKTPVYPVRVIGKQEAKDIAANSRAQGAFQTVGWQWDANVNWLCNCDAHCVSHRATELDWGFVPSMVTAQLVRPEACASCRECEKWCPRRGALTYGEDERPVIREAWCRGCGLCVEHCPRQALGYAPRRIYYDVLTKTVCDLGPNPVRL